MQALRSNLVPCDDSTETLASNDSEYCADKVLIWVV